MMKFLEKSKLKFVIVMKQYLKLKKLEIFELYVFQLFEF